MKIPLHELITSDNQTLFLCSAVNAFGHSFQQCYVPTCLCTRENLRLSEDFRMSFPQNVFFPKSDIDEV